MIFQEKDIPKKLCYRCLLDNDINAKKVWEWYISIKKRFMGFYFGFLVSKPNKTWVCFMPTMEAMDLASSEVRSMILKTASTISP